MDWGWSMCEESLLIKIAQLYVSFKNVEQLEVVANYSQSFDPHHCLPC